MFNFENKERVIKLINAGYNIKLIDKRYLKDFDVISALLLKNDYNISKIDHKNLNNKELILKSLKSVKYLDLYNAEILDEEIFEDIEVVERFLETCYNNKKFDYFLKIPRKYRFKFSFVFNIIKKFPKFYDMIEDDYKNDLVICKALIKIDFSYYDNLTTLMKANEELLVEAISNGYANYSNLLGNYQPIARHILKKVIDKTNSLEMIPAHERSLDLIVYALEIDKKSNLKYINLEERKKIIDLLT